MYLKSIAEGSIGIVSYIKGMGEAIQSALNIEEISIPNNTIMYYSPQKLTETTSTKTNALHTNGFGNAVLVSHTFEDGVGTITLDRDVTTLQGTFSGCSQVTKVILPNSVEEFKPFYVSGTTEEFPVFYKCNSIEEINFPKSLLHISLPTYGTYATKDLCNTKLFLDFEGGAFCFGTIFIGLKSPYSLPAIIPEGTTRIETYSLNGMTNLDTLILPKSTTYVGNLQLCKVTSLIIKSINVPNFEADFSQYYLDILGYIYVPDNAVNAYKQYFSEDSNTQNKIKPISLYG